MFWDILRDIGYFFGVLSILGVLAALIAMVADALAAREEVADERVEDWLPPTVRHQLWEDEIAEIIRGKGE